MRFVIVGGTFFIGPAVVEELAGAGHDVVAVSRGLHDGPDLPPMRRRACDRSDGAALAALLAELAPDVVVDTCCYTRAAAEGIARALPARARLITLSSMDVYRAFGSLLAGAVTDAVPLDESAPLRERRFLFRDRPDAAAVAAALPGLDAGQYEKLDVEEVCRAAGAIILRLPVVYGPRDPLRREEPILRRVRAGRDRIPIGAGNLLWTQGSVRDVASAVRLAGERSLDGCTLNVGERRTATARQWAERVLRAAGSKATLVTVADDTVPADLALTRALPQHLLVDSSRARALLGWSDGDPELRLAESVAWHLAHPPADAGAASFAVDDAALGAGGGTPDRA